MTQTSDSAPSDVEVLKPASSLGKVFLLLTKSLLTLFLMMILLIALMLTPWGSQTAIGLANSLTDELDIDYQQGGLGSKLMLDSLHWTQPNNQVSLDNVAVSINFSCFWRLAVCVDVMQIDKMKVVTTPTASAEKSEPNNFPLTLSFPLLLNNISVNQASIQVADTVDIRWKKLTANLDFYQRLRIENLYLEGLNVSTYLETDQQVTSQAKPIDWAGWQYDALTPIPIVLPVRFDVLALQLSDTVLQLAEQDKIEIRNIRLTAKANNQLLQLDELLVEHAQGQLSANGNIQLDGHFEHVFSVDGVAHLSNMAPIKLALHSSGNIQSLNTQIDLSQKEPSQTRPQKNGPLNVTAYVAAEPAKDNLPIDISIDWKNVIWPLTQSNDAPLDVTSKQGSIELQGNLQALTMNVLTTVSGNNIPPSNIDLQALATLAGTNKQLEVQKISLATLGGVIQSQGQLAVLDGLVWQGVTTLERIDPSTFWPALSADISGQFDTKASYKNGQWQGEINQLDIAGTWQEYPLKATGQVAFSQNNGVQLQALSLLNANNRLLLNGSVNQQQMLDIQFELDAQELSDSIPYLAGMLSFSGELSGSVLQPEMMYELAGTDLLLLEVLIDKVQGKGNLKWNDEKPVKVDLELTGIQGVNNHIESAKVHLSGNANKHQFEFFTSGQSTNVNLKIEGQLQETLWQGRWLTGEISSSYANLSLHEPFALNANWTTQQYNIAPHCWQHDDNELCIKQAELANNRANWDISLKEFDLMSMVQRFAPSLANIQTDSRLNLALSGDWELSQLPQAKVKASLSAATWQFRDQNDLNLSVDKVLVEAVVTQQNILTDIELSGEQIGLLDVILEGDLQGTPSQSTGVYDELTTIPIQGELLIERFDLSAYKTLLPQFDVLQGVINGTAKVSGTLASPMFTGDLSMVNGALKEQSLPVELSEIQQKIELTGQSAQLTGSYKLGQGEGQMTGNIVWLPELEGELQVIGEQLEFDYQNILKAKVTPDINLTFSPIHLAVTGEVTIPYARVKVRELPKGSISPSKDVILVEQQALEDSSEQALTLNLKLKIDPIKANQVKLEAFGLTTDLQGQLQLRNNKSDIFGSGEVQLVNGKYRAYGQNLLIREGDIIFNSTLDKPFLNIEAVRDPNLTEDGVIAGLRIQGDSQSPAVDVFSEPNMEQQQALSYVLTGRGLGESGGDSEDVMLTNALLSLGLGQSENLISKVGNKLGFEDVNVETSGQGDDRQFSLTGTLASGVQLGFNSKSEVTLRYKLLPQLYIEAVSGDENNNAIDIYYQFSIEGSQNKKVLND